jgi:hypothetical protein
MDEYLTGPGFHVRVGSPLQDVHRSDGVLIRTGKPGQLLVAMLDGAPLSSQETDLVLTFFGGPAEPGDKEATAQERLSRDSLAALVLALQAALQTLHE